MSHPTELKAIPYERLSIGVVPLYLMVPLYFTRADVIAAGGNAVVISVLARIPTEGRDCQNRRDGAPDADDQESLVADEMDALGDC